MDIEQELFIVLTKRGHKISTIPGIAININHLRVELGNKSTNDTTELEDKIRQAISRIRHVAITDPEFYNFNINYKFNSSTPYEILHPNEDSIFSFEDTRRDGMVISDRAFLKKEIIHLRRSAKMLEQKMAFCERDSAHLKRIKRLLTKYESTKDDLELLLKDIG